MFMSIGHRMADDLVKELLTQLDLALPQHGLIGLTLVPPELAPVRDSRGNELLSMLIFVDQPDMQALKIRRIWLRSLVCTLPPPLL